MYSTVDCGLTITLLLQDEYNDNEYYYYFYEEDSPDETHSDDEEDMLTRPTLDPSKIRIYKGRRRTTTPEPANRPHLVTLDVGRIIGNFHFFIVPLGTLGLISSVRAGANFL